MASQTGRLVFLGPGPVIMPAMIDDGQPKTGRGNGRGGGSFSWGLRFFPSSLEKPARKAYLFATVFFSLVFVATLWPVHAVFSRLRPFVLGLPFSLFYLATLLVLTFSVPLAPEVDLGDYTAYRRPFDDAEVSEEAVTQALEAIREQSAILVPVDRPAALGDVLGAQLVGRASDGSGGARNDISNS